MDFRLAEPGDLPQLQAVYQRIIEWMNCGGIQIWDDIYPCAFFADDMNQKRLFLLLENGVIVCAFALCESNAGAEHITWKSSAGKALYIDRLGVNVNFLRKGIGGFALQKAIALAREKGAESLRLFVVDINQPAISLYLKSGFSRADGIYEEIIDDDLVLHELGFEIRT